MSVKRILDLASSLEFSVANARMNNTTIALTPEAAQRIASELFIAAEILQRSTPSEDVKKAA
ncbi:hypothetical protein [Rhodobacter sp. 24-YEA-8]|uniref:hypothetical protein n=1 Tax=Rhodobacter sp. 24-YEA-8 TaxID=1884310 RepID=UPI00089BCF69|nr:hypothetical protein [Rhodobacter sp. 24-YEA-8]SEB96825.1 hypothetical protein SAMN05519105_1680 [Rhodobacter sp. 24-YEA-8]